MATLNNAQLAKKVRDHKAEAKKEIDDLKDKIDSISKIMKTVKETMDQHMDAIHGIILRIKALETRELEESKAEPSQKKSEMQQSEEDSDDQVDTTEAPVEKDKSKGVTGTVTDPSLSKKAKLAE